MISRKKRKFTLLCLSTAAIIGCVGAVKPNTSFNQPVKAYAASTGNWYIQNIYAKEETTHGVYFSASQNPSGYSSSEYFSTGIKVYSKDNTGGTYGSSSLKVSSNQFYIDFSEASAPKYGSSSDEKTRFDVKWRFSVSKNGVTSFYENFSVDDLFDTSVKTKYAVYSGYGVSTKRTIIADDSSNIADAQVNPRYFGKRTLNLADGEYSVKIDREYYWIKSDGTAIYHSTSKMDVNLIVDGTLPSIKMTDFNGKTVQNGGFVNRNVTVTAKDDHLSGLYYKEPGASSYRGTSGSYTTKGKDGWYYFYAKDFVDSETDVYSFYLDATLPVGSVSSDGKPVSNGCYISNSFAYTASDSGSGIDEAYCKSPISGTFIEYALGSIIPSTAGDGWYEFYSTDKAGNESSHFKVYLETSQPVFTLYRNGVASFSSTMESGKEYDTGIYFNRSDVMRIGCQTSSGMVSSNYQVNRDYKLSEEVGKTVEISVKTATGIASQFVCHVIDEKPYLTIGGKRYEDGSVLYFNKDVIAGFSPDSIQRGDAETGVTINGFFSSYSSIQTKELTGEEGKTFSYSISMNDRAGNVSRFTVVIDKENPSAKWVDGEGNPIANNGFSNKNVSLDYEADASAIYSYNGNEYQDYKNGDVFSEEGDYIVILTDKAGNKSTYSITIDKTMPVGKLYSDYEEVSNGTITKGKVYFTWDEDCTATVNGREYAKNSVISAEGTYNFVLTDKAGNSTSYRIEIDLTAPSNNKAAINGRHERIVSKWYNVEFGGKKTSFATYQEALDYACDREYEKYVTALYLDDVSKFNQTHLVASGEVHVGTYYRYKSVSSASNELYYFDEEGLGAAIESYAKAYVSDVSYFNPEGNDIGEIGNDFMYSDTWVYEGGSAPLINGYRFELSDSKNIYARLKGEESWTEVKDGISFEDQFHSTGLYEVKEVDEAGNESTYEVFLDLSSPELSVRAEVYGEGESKDIVVSKDAISDISAYYYKSFEIQKILDNDPYATISVTSDGKTKFYSSGDVLPTLDEGGKYEISVYDRLYNSYSFIVYIVGNEADVRFENNADNTAFDVDISLEQVFDAIVSLEIYKDGKKLDGVSPDVMHYAFDKGGTYKVIIKDNFGRIIEKTYVFEKALPEGMLSCTEGSKTKDNVSFTYDNSKYFAEVYKDGTLVETDTTGAVACSEDGEYSIKLINLTDSDNFRTYGFTIDKTAPDVELGGVKKDGKTNGDVTVSWDDKDVASATYTVNGGEEKTFKNGDLFSEEGTYLIIVKDDMGNTSTRTFVIDKTLDYEVKDTSGVSGAGTDMTTSENVVITNNENLHIEVKKDGESYVYSFGDDLSEEGRYEVRIYDDLGNSSSFTIIIDKSVDFSSNVSDGMTTNEDVWFANGEKSTIIVTKDGSPYSYGWGEKIAEEGTYVVKMYDSYGNEETITFTIDKSVDYKSSVKDGEATNSPVIINADEDVEISVTKDGEAIDYKIGEALSDDGHYFVTIKDVFGNEETFSFEIDTTAPEITINGIEDGGKGDTKVSLTDMTEGGEIHVYKDGNEIDYELGQELSDYGKYEIVVSDKLGNSRTYSFELAYQANGAAIALICVGVALIAGAVVIIVMKKKRVFKK